MPGSDRYPASERRIDLERPSIFRVRDYFLGGTASWAIDQFFGDEVLRKSPLMGDVARASQAFLKHVVSYLMKSGIRQFVDVGSGVLTRGSTHQVADELAGALGLQASASVVYTTSDPITAALAEVQLDRFGDLRRHAVVEATMQDVDNLWQQVLDTDVIDENQPVALLLVGTLDLHQAGMDDDGSLEAVTQLRELLAADSYVALSHLTDEDLPGNVRESLAEADRLYTAWTHNSLVCRSRAEIAEMLAGLEVVELGWPHAMSNWHTAEADPVSQLGFPATGILAPVRVGLGHKQ
jgi:hypothetical protein